MTAAPHTTRQNSSREAFDATLLYDAINRARVERGTPGRPLSWREVARQAHIASGGIGHEIAQGRQPTAGVLAKLLLWLGDTDLAPYLRDGWKAPGQRAA